MTRQPTLARRAEAMLGTAVVATTPIAGGDVARATRLRLSDGRLALMKTLSPAPDGLFAAEARGLAWLRAAHAGGGVPVPQVLAVAGDALILEWVEPGSPSTEGAEAFGRALAATHRAGAPSFGAEQDGWIAKLPLPNRACETWAEFYAVRRLLPYLKVAHDRAAVTDDEAATIERVVGRLPTLLPEEPPARLHGDLWNGNVVWDASGTGWLIDPASYGGHREADLAMLALFGLPQLERVRAAYAEAHPLSDGWEERVGLHQLFPLLVHAVRFGPGYGARAAEVAARLV